MLAKLIDIFSGGAGKVIGNGVTIVGILAALTPAVIWLAGNKDVVFISLTYGDLSFWGVIVAAQISLAWLIKSRTD